MNINVLNLLIIVAWVFISTLWLVTNFVFGIVLFLATGTIFTKTMIKYGLMDEIKFLKTKKKKVKK